MEHLDSTKGNVAFFSPTSNNLEYPGWPGANLINTLLQKQKHDPASQFVDYWNISVFKSIRMAFLGIWICLPHQLEVQEVLTHRAMDYLGKMIRYFLNLNVSGILGGIPLLITTIWGEFPTGGNWSRAIIFRTMLEILSLSQPQSLHHASMYLAT